MNIKDYGFEAGGPIKKGRAWFWGGIGKQNINVGINNFFKDDTACQQMKADLSKDPLSHSIEETRGCLNSDTTLLNNYNAKVGVELFRNNQFSFLFNGAEKVRNARDASDLRPLETTYRQMGVLPSSGLGSSWWKTGMPKTYKWSDRHIFNDRWMVEASYAHVGNNFALTFHDDSLRDVQAAYETTTQAWARSYQEAVYVRPTDSIDAWSNYFLPGFGGGDHAFKFGMKLRTDDAVTQSMYGGDAYARFTSTGQAAFTTPAEAQLYRRGSSLYTLQNRNFYVQDTYSRKQLTIIAGFRYDYQYDFANAQSVGASPFFGQATFKGTYKGVDYPGATFNQLPALSFDGYKPDVAYKTFSPRVGVTYDLTGNGRNVFKFNFARYVDQLGSSGLSSYYNTVGLTYVTYPWVDLNSDKFIQANEIVLTSVPNAYTSGYNYNNPTQTTTTGSVDPGLKPGRTSEYIASFDRQISNDFAVSASYIYRKYTDFNWSDYNDWDTSDYRAVQWAPVASTCPAGASCPTVTYYEPTSQRPVNYVVRNQPGYWRTYSGFELSARKRMSKSWMMNASFAYNDAPVHYTEGQGYEDPTSIMTSYNGGQYAPESTSSGLGNVFVNQKWIFRLSGAYTLPLWQIGVAGTLNERGGNPYIRSVQTPFNRPFSGGRATIYLDRRGDVRLPNFQNLDLRVDKPFTIAGRVKLMASMDIFNLFNGNTTLSMRGGQNAANANTISSLLAPRVLRFGVRATF